MSVHKMSILSTYQTLQFVYPILCFRVEFYSQIHTLSAETRTERRVVYLSSCAIYSIALVVGMGFSLQISQFNPLRDSL